MNKVDLHMHTFYSDGKASPKELLTQARDIGLKAIAISDHETTRGNKEGQLIASDYGVELVPAIEVTCHWDGFTGHGNGPDIDVLGYFVDLESDALARLEASQQANIKERAVRVCKVLESEGYNITIEDVMEINPYFPGFMPIYYTLEKSGVASQDIFNILEPSWHRSGPLDISITEVIRAIHEAGGVAVLAHPSIIKRERSGVLLAERGLMQLARAGLDAIEVLHYRLDNRQRQHFSRLAKAFNLPITGGSDEHRGFGEFSRFGSEDVSLEMLDKIRELSQKYN